MLTTATHRISKVFVFGDKGSQYSDGIILLQLLRNHTMHFVQKWTCHLLKGTTKVVLLNMGVQIWVNLIRNHNILNLTFIWQINPYYDWPCTQWLRSRLNRFYRKTDDIPLKETFHTFKNCFFSVRLSRFEFHFHVFYDLRITSGEDWAKLV